MAGIGTRKLTVTINSVDYTAEVSKAEITSNDAGSDFTTFADAAAGGKREYRLEITAVQDADTASFWTEMFDNTGDTVPFVLMPYGNATPSVAEPHFEGNCTITEPDGTMIGGEANSSTTARQTIDVAWVCDARPTKVTT